MQKRQTKFKLLRSTVKCCDVKINQHYKAVRGTNIANDHPAIVGQMVNIGHFFKMSPIC